MTESLSIDQARKLVLLSQRLPPGKPVGSPMAATLSAIEHLGYIQIDTISAVQRAHHHTLWNRNPGYVPSHLEQLVADKQVFEYWSHAAAYLPMRDYRFSLPRKHATASGAQRHWYERDKPLMQTVLQRIAAEGPLMAKDFEHTGSTLGEWKSKPAKRALEYLFMQGELMISGRVNFHKVYDLTERVLPEGVDTRLPTPDEHARFLITRYLQANGLGQAAEVCYLQKNTKPRVAAVLRDMVASGAVVPISVGAHRYHALPASLALLNKPLRRSRLHILSPFDNLLIQRKRMQALFDFDYLLECYVPAAKRQHGYFSLPILWGGALVARMDCKAERHASVLHVHHLVLEPRLTRIEEFAQALSKALAAFMAFNGCRTACLHRCTPASASPAMEAVMTCCRA
ncbi:winged helix-turn-helix domain-containing protein [Denitromonas ohlonensis]|uniref:Winged helix-turn-helix domain-containing protein n=2 Tax=Denitromonas TaxID=139331 RepID=A0A557RHX2_9RHOO|nr:crosslink repair DNA glycosylase YcaQ family protein [Denitromonas ohlonensis]TVO64771.1 winged helix-turn-helix domain-containing protein [Denitromonas ohlonensis]TVO70376.1 winged helix-turn-helix domain-containing protein [Denitromonas ohlonensis]TVT69953.1 MAG: winged helix-turn-helix domain-containing protein [Denitromonas halophila]